MPSRYDDNRVLKLFWHFNVHYTWFPLHSYDTEEYLVYYIVVGFTLVTDTTSSAIINDFFPFSIIKET